MKLQLGLVYLTGSAKKDQRDGQPKTITLGFWNADSPGESYRYIRFSFHEEDSIEMMQSEVALQLENMKQGKFEGGEEEIKVKVEA
jgi:hypothetical protein